MRLTTRQSRRWSLIYLSAALAVASGFGCIADPYEPPPRSSRSYDRLVDTRSGTPQPEAPPRPMPPAQPQPQQTSEPPIDRTGIRVADLPISAQRLQTAGPWQDAIADISSQIDAPELKRNLHEGMSALAPRIARALMDYNGETAIITVAVYREGTPRPPFGGPGGLPPEGAGSRSVMFAPAAVTAPVTQPTTAPSTQPVYVHAALALAFEGFNARLDGTFVPRVLSDQPRTADDGREPIDPTLALDQKVTHYLLFRLKREGMMAASLTHDEMRRQLADAVQALPRRDPNANPPTTAPATPRTEAIPPVPAPLPPAAMAEPVPQYAPDGPYDSGAYWPPQYGDGFIGGTGYPWGSGVDPYLYGLYGCGWYSPYYATRAGWYGRTYAWGDPWWVDPYWGGGYAYWGGRRHWRDRDRDNNGGGDNDNPNRPGNRPPVETSTRYSTRGQVPWSRPPIVSPANPPAASNGFEQSMSIPAQPGRSSSAAVPRDSQGRMRLGPTVDSSRIAGPTLGPARSNSGSSGSSSSGSARSASFTVSPPPASSSGSSSRTPMQLGPRVDPSRVAGPTLGPSRSSGGESPRSIAPSPSAGSSSGGSKSGASSGGSSSGGGKSGGGSSGGSSSGGSRSGGGSSGGSSGGGKGK